MLQWDQGADNCCGASLHQAIQGSEITIPFPKVFLDQLCACETSSPFPSPLLCQLEGVSLPRLWFQDGSSHLHITHIYIFSTFEY